MKKAFILTFLFLLMVSVILACSSPAPTSSPPSAEAEATRELNATATVEPAATFTAIAFASPQPTAALLQLEIVQWQVWTDKDGNTRVNVLMRNPYDFPVAPTYRANAELLDAAGQITEIQELLFLDGISGGNGFFLPGETIAANACFNCEAAPLTEEWTSIQFEAVIEDASSKWDYSTNVAATVGSVSFEGDGPLFTVNGTIRNNTDSVLQRISARVVVFDDAGNLIGTAEASAWDVGPGASASFNGLGIGQKPDGAITYEVSALGVNY